MADTEEDFEVKEILNIVKQGTKTKLLLKWADNTRSLEDITNVTNGLEELLSHYIQKIKKRKSKNIKFQLKYATRKLNTLKLKQSNNLTNNTSTELIIISSNNSSSEEKTVTQNSCEIEIYSNEEVDQSIYTIKSGIIKIDKSITLSPNNNYNNTKYNSLNLKTLNKINFELISGFFYNNNKEVCVYYTINDIKYIILLSDIYNRNSKIALKYFKKMLWNFYYIQIIQRKLINGIIN